MRANELRRRFIDFFVKKHQHQEIWSASLIPENDATVLFTTAGMHPLVPYLLGERHPLGKRLVDCQKCLRTDDIEEVGDNTHLTFFEMLGNWSLQDYFKKDAIQMSYEFLTSSKANFGIGLDPNRLMISCFEGDQDAPRDDEAAKFWEKLGFSVASKKNLGAKRLIFFYEKKKNWWGPAGQTGPCGPDTEMFYDLQPELPSHLHKSEATKAQIAKYSLKDGSRSCHPNCECGRYVEIWNDVFMQYNKKLDGSFEPLKKPNVDTGMGLERVAAILQGKESHFEIELFKPLMKKIIELRSQLGSITAKFLTNQEFRQSQRIIADHLRSAVFILGDPKAVTPSNTDQGYVLRRLIRRAIRHGRKIGILNAFSHILAEEIVSIFADVYPELKQNRDFILEQLIQEEEKFNKTLHAGEKEFEKIMSRLLKEGQTMIGGQQAFTLYDTYGFPLEMTKDLAKEHNLLVDEEAFNISFAHHQELSRQGAQQKFSGGLADHSEETTKLHTATHLLHAALRKVLGEHVYQRGSNITAERLRFDFSHGEKLNQEQINKVEELVNQAIEADLPVQFAEMTVSEAKKQGAIGIFTEKYGEKVKVYTVGKSMTDFFSKEICGGPHVRHTGLIGRFKIVKEEACGSGVRRIKAVVEGL